MKNAKKWAFAGLFLFIAGVILMFAALSGSDFSFEKLGNQRLIDRISEPEGKFDCIFINISNADVLFAHAPDGKTRVEIRENEKLPHSVQIDDNTLRITSEDMRQWQDKIGFWGGNTSVKVYLPDDFYESAIALTLTGDIRVPSGFSFGNLDVCTSTGKIEVSGVDSEKMTVNGTTGRVILSDIEILNELNAHMTTGDISISGLKAQNMTASSTTGDVNMTDVAIENLMNITVTTGDITFSQTDTQGAMLKATTGDIKGTFLTEKIFDAKATTGSVCVPQTNSGSGLCHARTTTGHIDISIGG